MKRASTLIVLTAVVVAVVLGAGLVAVAYSGAVNVAASHNYLPGAQWFFGTLSDNSIRSHARSAAELGEITTPSEVTDAMLRKGASEYVAMCAPCHGAPAGPAGRLGKGMKPEPPALAHTAREMEFAEVSWVIHHGIRHTGMPGFGETHSAEDLQAIAAFVERFDGMTPADYERWTKEAGASGAHGH